MTMAEQDCCPGCHGSVITTTGDLRRRCVTCGTIWMPERRHYTYDDSYPEKRYHHHPAVGRCKQITLQTWIRRLGIDLPGRRVLEMGFGSGATLQWLQNQGAFTFGQEPVDSNRLSAVQAGIPADRVRASVGDFAGEQFDLALYLDSFEHVIEPDAALQELNTVTSAGAKAIVVLPVGDCVSRRLMGKWWPHDVVDHWVFYSDGGLTALWQRSGWQLKRRFYPPKFLSALTFAQTIEYRYGIKIPLGPFASSGLWLNFGERGYLFEKS